MASSTTSAWSATCAATKTIRVTGTDAYAEAQWWLLDPWRSPSACARAGSTTTPPITSSPRPIPTTAARAPTTTRVRSRAWSGMRRTTSTSISATGRVSRPRPSPSSPTSPTGPGLNFNLDPATSTAYELGLKWLPPPSQRVNLAIFTAQTKQEIVVNTATGGRTTYANAGRTRAPWRRSGVGRRAGAWRHRARELHVAARAFRRSLHSGPPPVVVPAGPSCPACRRSRPTAC